MLSNDDKWLAAIKEADTSSTPGRNKSGDLKPLAELLRSDAVLPRAARNALADLLMHHRLAPCELTDSQSTALVLAEFAKEFREQPNWPHGPIKKAEMEAAAKIMQAREKAKSGRVNVRFDGKAAASELRAERLRAFADYNGLFEWKDGKRNYTAFENAVLGKHSTINRQKKSSR